VVVMAVTALAGSGFSVLAQDSPTTIGALPVSIGAPVPQLTSGAAEVAKLAQAKVGDDTIIAYIKNSAKGYGLTANQIIYLRQNGVSDAVLTAMLQSPGPRATAALPVTYAPAPVVVTKPVATVSTPTVAPTVTYVQTIPAAPCYNPEPYSYPAYAWIPPISLSFAWGNCWHVGWHH